MRVGLDAHMVGGQETGNETYVKGLVDGFKPRTDVDVIVYTASDPWTGPSSHLRFQRLVTPNPYVRLGLELPLRSLGQGLDVLHVSYTAPIWSAAPLVLTVHDICYATNPEWFSAQDVRMLSDNVPRSIGMAAHVVTDSENARSQIIEHYRVPEAKISAIQIGPGAAGQPIDLEEARAQMGTISTLGLDAQRPYLLVVGNLQPRKNLIRLVDAFKVIVERGHDVDLLIVGPSHYHAEEAFQAATKVAGRVRFTGYVTDRQLAACYRCSEAFIFPSLYEGFGLPALEAMSHGVPVACSNAGALPELCGDAALLFDPLSVEAMVEAIERILSDGDLRRALSAAGVARAAQYSWAKTAELTLDVYRKAKR